MSSGSSAVPCRASSVGWAASLTTTSYACAGGDPLDGQHVNRAKANRAGRRAAGAGAPHLPGADPGESNRDDASTHRAALKVGDVFVAAAGREHQPVRGPRHADVHQAPIGGQLLRRLVIEVAADDDV